MSERVRERKKGEDIRYTNTSVKLNELEQIVRCFISCFELYAYLSILYHVDKVLANKEHFTYNLSIQISFPVRFLPSESVVFTC